MAKRRVIKPAKIAEKVAAAAYADSAVERVRWARGKSVALKLWLELERLGVKRSVSVVTIAAALRGAEK